MELTPKLIDELVPLMLDRPALFVVGAGASFGLSPSYGFLRGVAEQLTFDAGGFCPGYQPGIEVVRLYGSHEYYSSASPYVRHIGAGTLRGIMYAELQVSQLPGVCNPYQVFNRAHPGGCILSFNVDGIAERSVQTIPVFAPHGSLLRIHGSVEGLRQLTRDSLRYGVDLSGMKEGFGGLTLSVPEPLNITSLQPEYAELEPHFDQCESVIIVGYSFGRVGDDIDDRETLRYLASLLNRRQKPVYVVDIAPEHTTGMIDQWCPGVRVVPVKASWRPLTMAVLRLFHEFGGFPLGQNGGIGRAVYEYYSRACSAEDVIGPTHRWQDYPIETLALARCGDMESPLSRREFAFLCAAFRN